MLKYKTTQRIALSAGKVGLTNSQANPRSHRLTCLETPADPNEPGGIFEITGEIVFKAGEILRIDDPDKHTLRFLKPMEQEDAEAAVEETASADPDPFASSGDAGKPAKRGRKSKAS